MERAKMVKNPVSNKLPVETVVIDDEETIAPSPVNDNLVHLESVPDLANKGHPIIDNDMHEIPSLSVDVQLVDADIDVTLDRDNLPAVDKKVQEVLVDCMTDSVVKEKPVKTTSAVPRGIGETIHPLFISCLLDKVR